ncbi:hypothetical protein IW140_003276 [Coemansia sp. RSA 1813]|nr:hypothetical protein EV178_002895 [Coemansia sp. RSA 1646]KAJ1771685.1 hypothetical protein LPJ74_002112 [Coemansia sp. RSA 1843]KAJ2214126.1 hypothetical protein EV179_003265 [Coemansia sp. RSA 487]KAJ2569184.1 hypothetical protein IW140_003276 [Coemansia sp. RSA 1813]
MSVAPSPITSTFIAIATNHIHVDVIEVLEGPLDPDDEFYSGIDSENENAVSLVAVLCGLVPCEPNSINNVRLANQSTDSADENSDKILDPFYRPSTTPAAAPSSKQEEDSDDEGGGDLDENAPMHVSEGGKELTADDQPSNVGRNAAIGVTVAVVALVLVILYMIRRRNKRRRRLMLSEQDDQSTHSANSTTFLPISPASVDNTARGSTPRNAAQSTHEHESRVSMHRLNTDQTVSTVAMSPFASPPPPLPSRTNRTNAGPEMVQIPRPSRSRSTAPGQRRRPPPPPPPPPLQALPPLVHTEDSHSTTVNNNTPIDTYDDYYPPPPVLIRRPSLILEPGRQRAATFSEISGDELPPYVDPIEEAMSLANAPDNDASASSNHHPFTADPQPNPPPYYTG